MEILEILKKDLSPRTVEERKSLLLSKFLNHEIIALEVNENTLQGAEEKLDFQALKELEYEEVLKCHQDTIGKATFFLAREVSEYKKDFSLSFDFCEHFAKIYNNLMPRFRPEDTVIEPLQAHEVDDQVIEALTLLLSLTTGVGESILNTALPLDETGPLGDEGEDGQDNTFTIE